MKPILIFEDQEWHDLPPENKENDTIASNFIIIYKYIILWLTFYEIKSALAINLSPVI